MKLNLFVNHSPIKYYIILVRQGKDLDWKYRYKGDKEDFENSYMVETKSDANIFTLHGLNPSTVYSFKVIAVNGIGRSRESKQSFYMETLRRK